jgi:hypothetical protein
LPYHITQEQPYFFPSGAGAGAVNHLMLSPVPDEVFAGRLAEAEAESFKGEEPPCSAPVVREQDGNAGAPESKKTESEQG